MSQFHPAPSALAKTVLSVISFAALSVEEVQDERDVVLAFTVKSIGIGHRSVSLIAWRWAMPFSVRVSLDTPSLSYPMR